MKTLVLEDEEVGIVMAGLGELLAKRSLKLILKIDEQCQEQHEAPTPDVSTEETA
jgi:hypothetical protein